jgi:acyl-CoA thioester hydrolase
MVCCSHESGRVAWLTRAHRFRSDNDQYAHMNNAIYYHLYDSIVNDYLTKHCGVQATSSPVIGLVVTSFSDFFRPLGYPQVLELGLRVSKLGGSSVTYEIGVFEEGVESAAAVGGYTHVFVESGSRKTGNMSKEIRKGLEKLLVVGSKL